MSDPRSGTLQYNDQTPLLKQLLGEGGLLRIQIFESAVLVVESCCCTLNRSAEFATKVLKFSINLRQYQWWIGHYFRISGKTSESFSETCVTCHIENLSHQLCHIALSHFVLCCHINLSHCLLTLFCDTCHIENLSHRFCHINFVTLLCHSVLSHQFVTLSHRNFVTSFSSHHMPHLSHGTTSRVTWNICHFGEG